MMQMTYTIKHVCRGMLLTTFIAVVAVGQSVAQGPMERICATSDLPGTWEMIRLRAFDGVDRTRDFALLQEFQVMKFGPGSTFQRIGASKPLPPEQSSAFLAASPSEGYQLHPNGVLEFLNGQGRRVAVAECLIFIQDNPQVGFSAGTVTILWRTSGKPAIAQAFKKVAE